MCGVNDSIADVSMVTNIIVDLDFMRTHRTILTGHSELPYLRMGRVVVQYENSLGHHSLSLIVVHSDFQFLPRQTVQFLRHANKNSADIKIQVCLKSVQLPHVFLSSHVFQHPLCSSGEERSSVPVLRLSRTLANLHMN